jgi:hypothetical protein
MSEYLFLIKHLMNIKWFLAEGKISFFSQKITQRFFSVKIQNVPEIRFKNFKIG